MNFILSRIIKKKLFLYFLIVIFITSCAGKKPVEKSDLDVLTKGEGLFEEEKYEKAEASFKKLLEEYPDSKLMVKAQLGLADTLYKQKKYDEAILQYSHFIDLYPAHKNRDKAHFYKAMSFYDQKKTIDRDQSYSRNALEEFEYIIETFPESEFIKKSQLNATVSKQDLAKSFLSIGKFYYRTSAYHSAIRRFKDFIKNYKDQDFADEAFFYLGKSYLKKEMFTKADEIFNVIITNYPDSKYANKAKKILVSSRSKAEE